MAKNPDLKPEWFVPVSHVLLNRFGACGRDIESRACGLSQLKAICAKYALPNEPWHSGIAAVPDSLVNTIAKAFAEWADGDTVSAHYAYENDYLCTRDNAKSAGGHSVFSEVNRTWLSQYYGVEFITPDELAKKFLLPSANQ